MTLKRSLCIACIGWLSFSHTTYAVPRYTLDAVGLSGLEHTANDGLTTSNVHQLNEAGQAIGYSIRHNGSRAWLGQSAWLYDGGRTKNIGLIGAEHTSSDGVKGSTAEQLNEAGQVIGHSVRYNGGSDYQGNSAWLYYGSRTKNIGLLGAVNTSPDGVRNSSAHQLNEAGQVIGSSVRYSRGGSHIGSSAWLYNGSRTVGIGLTGVEYVAIGHYRVSEARQLNEAGQVIGYSNRYNGGIPSTNQYLRPNARSAWLYDGSRTVNISLTGADYTRNDGHQFSDVRQINEAGQVLGHSARYNGGSASLGSSIWLYDGLSTFKMGLTDAEHTRKDGFRGNRADELNEAGQVIGSSSRYNGGSVWLGQSAWLFDGLSTFNIGPTGVEHTRNDGYRYSNATQFNEAGQAMGHSDRYDGGSTDLGRTAWLYDGNRTVNIGLTGVEHTGNDGYKTSNGVQLNEAGQVFGWSSRFNSSGEGMGVSTWFYDGSSTVNIGPTGAEHTRADGYQVSNAEKMNEAGQVIGAANRYDGGSVDLGRTVWFYDPATDMTYYSDFTVRPVDTYTSPPYHQLLYLGEDGLMAGYYEEFDIDGSFLSQRAFGFTVEDGFFDLGLAIEGGLESFGWDHLITVDGLNEMGQIVGLGWLSDNKGRSLYLATPSPVPLPPAVWLFGSGLLGLIGLFRRKALF